jgi:hypothetical protein
MPPIFLFGTSCSLETGPFMDFPVIGYSLKALRADYSRENFFPENKLTLDEEFGLIPQAASRSFGKGRDAVWTDSTVFSNFWFYMPGKSELCLGTINWLNHRNRFGLMRWVFGLIALGALLYTVRRPREMNSAPTMIYLLIGALICVPLGTRAFAAMNHAAFPLPAPHKQLPRIAFEREHCNFTLPAEVWDTSVALENHYHTFYAWTQRLGYMPNYSPTLDSSLSNARVVVFINPYKEFTPQELRQIKQYLEKGGRLLVLDGAHNRNSTANSFLMNYSFKIDETAFAQSWVFDKKKTKVAAINLPRPVTGGEPLLTMALDKPFISAAKVGKGLIAVMGSSHLFADRSMGTTSSVPSAVQSGLYETEFWLFRNLMEGPSDPKQWNSPPPIQNDYVSGIKATQKR